MTSQHLIILFSYHHRNTEKIAQKIAEVLQADIRKPEDVHLDELSKYDIVGFGSGIYGGKHHRTILELAERLPSSNGQRVFLFSTSAMTGERKMKNDHSTLREILESKGYEVVSDFQCKGFNTNSFMRFFGGMNKGHPDSSDLANAERFIHDILG